MVTFSKLNYDVGKYYTPKESIKYHKDMQITRSEKKTEIGHKEIKNNGP